MTSSSSNCPLCDGAGMRIIQRPNGRTAAEPCECVQQMRTTRLLQRARIPPRYKHCNLENFAITSNMNESLRSAQRMARKFAEGYPVLTEGKGLLLTGSIGVGKTHLAVGLLRALIAEKGAQGLFYDYRELLKEIQGSYNPQSTSSELDILRPVFETEILLLDELGAVKPSEWVWDTVALILNYRYNKEHTTIITTNYPHLPPGGDTGNGMREETLGDRIGERMRSRLSEMCVSVEMHGKDFRQGVRMARIP